MLRLGTLTTLLLCSSVSAEPLHRVHHAVAGIYLSQANTAPLRISGSVTQIAESTRVKMLAAIARGDTQSAIVLWQAHTGRQDIPGWLRAFQSAFNVANQKAGPCIEVAKSIFAGFRNLGKEPTYLKFTSKGTERGANLLAFEVRAGDPRSTIQISDNFVHYAVQVENRIYDAFTGPQGLAVAAYTKRLISPLGNITTEKVSVLP